MWAESCKQGVWQRNEPNAMLLIFHSLHFIACQSPSNNGDGDGNGNGNDPTKCQMKISQSTHSTYILLLLLLWLLLLLLPLLLLLLLFALMPIFVDCRARTGHDLGLAMPCKRAQDTANTSTHSHTLALTQTHAHTHTCSQCLRTSHNIQRTTATRRLQT